MWAAPIKTLPMIVCWSLFLLWSVLAAAAKEGPYKTSWCEQHGGRTEVVLSDRIGTSISARAMTGAPPSGPRSAAFIGYRYLGLPGPDPR